MRRAVASLAVLSVILLATLQVPASATTVATREHRIRIAEVTTGLERPWGLAFLPDGRMLVTERAGRLRVIDRNGVLDAAPVAGLPRVDAHGQGGLMDVVLHPQYASNGWIYWTFVQRDADGHGTEVARGRLAGRAGNWRMEGVEVLFRMAPKSGARQHFGSRIVFDRDGMMFVTLGDRGEMTRAQRLDDHAGKILRLTDDGKPAPGNPFAGTAGARAEIWSLGHRNVQGAALHPATGELWTSEHGPQGGDELNRPRAGRNHGWPVVTFGVNYRTGTKIGEGTEKPGMEPPVKHWIPSPAVAGIAFYDGARFARWRGDLLVAALKAQAIIRVRLDGDRFVADEFIARGTLPRVRDVRVGPDGLVYLLTDESRGALLRLEPAD